MNNDRRDPMNNRRETDKWNIWDKRIRDALIFTVGILGCINELFILPEPRPTAFIILGGLIGVPFVLSADASKNGNNKNGKSILSPRKKGDEDEQE